MGLKKCKECGQEVSTSAKACPKCGVDSPAGGSSIGRALLYGIGGLILVSMCSSLTGKKNPPNSSAPTTTAEPTASTTEAASKPEPVVKPELVTAARIVADFQKNEVTAEDHYADRCFDVTGIVDRIDAGLGDDATLNLRGGFMGMLVSKIPRSFAKTLSKGDAVELPVKGVTEILGSPVASYSVECARISRAADEQEELKKAAAAAERKAKQTEAAAAKRAKSTTTTKASSKRRLELPCRPGQQPPCFD